MKQEPTEGIREREILDPVGMPALGRMPQRLEDCQGAGQDAKGGKTKNRVGWMPHSRLEQNNSEVNNKKCSMD